MINWKIVLATLTPTALLALEVMERVTISKESGWYLTIFYLSWFLLTVVGYKFVKLFLELEEM